MGMSGQRHAPAALCPGIRTPGTHCTGGWVDPRAGLDTEVRGRPACSQTLYWLSYAGSPIYLQNHPITHKPRDLKRRCIILFQQAGLGPCIKLWLPYRQWSDGFIPTARCIQFTVAVTWKFHSPQASQVFTALTCLRFWLPATELPTLWTGTVSQLLTPFYWAVHSNWVGKTSLTERYIQLLTTQQ
jgi:hypothetical protein